MKYLTRMLAYTRLLVLRRQWKSIQQWLITLPVDQEARLATLVYDQAVLAANHPTPQFYGSVYVESYSPWGDAADTAYALTRSLDVREQTHGIAVWLAVVFHETRNAPVAALRRLHVDVSYDFQRLRNMQQQLLAIRQAA